MRYLAFIHEENGAYGVSFPDFPGCVTAGDTEQEALTNAIEALGGHVATMEDVGEPIPAPGTYKTALRPVDLEELKEGATLATVPLIVDRGQTKRVNVTFDPGLLDAIDDEAKRLNMTRSSFLASAARNMMAG
nr:type II toxin-antitoxin system HicB family antitoxin [uncultured Cohaesibacter sp.]